MGKKKTEPSTDLVKSLPGFEISSELAAIQAKIEQQGGEILPGDFEALKEWNAALEIKAESICHVITKKQLQATYFQQISDAARAKAEGCDKVEKRLKAMLLAMMLETKTLSIKKDDGLFTVSLVEKGKASLKITDSKKIPLDYIAFETVETVKTKELKAALEAEQEKPQEEQKEIPGASLEYGAPYLMIRS